MSPKSFEVTSFAEYKQKQVVLDHSERKDYISRESSKIAGQMGLVIKEDLVPVASLQRTNMCAVAKQLAHKRSFGRSSWSSRVSPNFTWKDRSKIPICAKRSAEQFNEKSPEVF